MEPTDRELSLTVEGSYPYNEVEASHSDICTDIIGQVSDDDVCLSCQELKAIELDITLVGEQVKFLRSIINSLSDMVSDLTCKVVDLENKHTHLETRVTEVERTSHANNSSNSDRTRYDSD
jgi:hypothetical protein